MNEHFEHKIKSSLQQYAKDHSPEPLPGHEERFEMALLKLKENKQVKRMPRWPWIALAAASVAAIIVAIVVKEVKVTNEYADKVKLSDVSGEMAAVEEYYHDRLQMDYSNMNSSDANVKRFLADIKRMEDEYKMLEETLAKNFRNEKVTQAMVNNYKIRLRLMEQMQKYIEIQNQINTQNNEKQAS
jgi:glutaredoxin-related protein